MPASRVGTDKLGRAFLIRPSTPGDREALYRMYLSFEPKRGAQGLPPAGAQSIARWLDAVLDQGTHVVVEVDQRTMGHGMLLPFEPGAAELANFLHQSVRDAGIGTSLNHYLIELGRDLGLARLWLSVEPSNRRAIRSYEKVGFRVRHPSVLAPEIEMDVSLLHDR